MAIRPEDVDVFVSYSHEDRSRVQPLVRRLQERSWRVWWDPEIPPGAAYRQQIDAALEHAACVIVLWTRTSVHSSWVQFEASQARRRNVLLSVQLDDVPVPPVFEDLQAAQLWMDDAAEQAQGLRALLNAANTMVAGSRATTDESGEPADDALLRVASGLVVSIADCGTLRGRTIEIGSAEPPLTRLNGRVLAEDIWDQENRNEILRSGSTLNAENLRLIAAAGQSTVLIRSPICCDAPIGVCALCAGVLGEPPRAIAVGTRLGPLIEAALSVYGGAGPVDDILNCRVEAPAIMAELDGRVQLVESGVLVRDPTFGLERFYEIDDARRLLVRDGDRITAGDLITTGQRSIVDVVRIQGVAAVSEYIVERFRRETARLGRPLDESIAEMLVKLMTARVAIIDAGHTSYRVGELVLQQDVHRHMKSFYTINRDLANEPLDLPIWEPTILGLDELARRDP